MVVKIERLDHTGKGIALVDGIVTFIPNVVPSDIVDIVITTKKAKYQEGKVIKLITPSFQRIKEFCPYYNECGGCQLQNYNYSDTLNYKKNQVINIFKKLNLLVDPLIISNDCNKNYRNKIELKVENKKIGFYKLSTNKIVEINYCPITNNTINNIIPLLNKINIINGNITLRVNKEAEILVIIDTNDALNLDILKTNNFIKGIIVNKKLRYGQSDLKEIVNNLKYKIEYDSFFQINPYVSSKLFNLIKENLNKEDNVLDLYCGVGAISIQISLIVKTVLGIEIIPNAIKNALENKKINNLTNVNFICGDVLKKLSHINNIYNVYIFDPPRKGLDLKIINIINNNLPKKIIYVSCNVHTLVRDLNFLMHNYKITKLYVLDMFSYSYHVECLCVLSLR